MRMGQVANQSPQFIAKGVQESVASVTYLKTTAYRDLNVAGTLDYMSRRFVAPLKKLGVPVDSLADCAAGFGWLSFAFLLGGANAQFSLNLTARGWMRPARLRQFWGCPLGASS